MRATVLRLTALAALVALAVFTGSAASHGMAKAVSPQRARPQTPRVPAKSASETGPAKLVITVVDGDRRVRVPDARVHVLGRTGTTGSDGAVSIKIPHLQPLTVSVSAPGFSERSVLEPFADTKHATIRIYRPDLQWPLYGATDSRTQAQSHIRLRPPFRVVWSRSIGGLIEFPAVVEDGVAYIGNAKSSVRAISMRFGTQLWRHDTPGSPRMASSPAVSGDTLVYHTMDGHVVVLDRANGRQRWTYDVGSPIESSPILRDGVDYFGDWDGRLYALDLRTHRLRWTRTLGAKITSSASLAGGTLYIGDYAGRLWALSAGTGATRWVRTVNGRIYGTPAVAGDRVFVPSSTGDSLTAFSTAGRELWRVATGGYVYSSPAVWNGRVFFGSYDGYLYAVSAASGRVAWRQYADGPISGAAVVVDGVVYAGSFAHRIIGVDAASGKRLLTFGHGHYVPVSGNGMRLLFHGYSRLYAVEPKQVSKR